MLRSLRGLESNPVNASTGINPIVALIREGKRWTHNVLGYDVQGRDYRVGDVQDLILDDHTGDVRYLVVTENGEWSRDGVLLAPNWTCRISWAERKLFMDVAQHVIHDSPAWARATPLTREYEARLHDHYGRPPYWASGEETEKLAHGYRGDNAGRPRSDPIA